MLRDKWMLIGVIATIVVIIGGVFLFTKGDSQNPEGSPNPVSQTVLIPDYAQETGGINATDSAYLKPNPDAKVTIVEFGDYQCPACAAYTNSIVKPLLKEFAGKINYIFRDFAFIGLESTRASEATYCAADQDEYWQFHDYLYSHQNGENKGAFSDDNLKSFAKDLGLNMDLFNSCFDTNKYKSQVASSVNDASLLRLNSTPSFFINGQKVSSLPGNYDQFKALVNSYLQ